MKTALLLCLALNIYYEARGESTQGQIAVAHVTQNRVEHNHSSICREVFKKNQFSWTRTSYQIPRSSDKAWQKALTIAKTFQHYKDPTSGCRSFSGTDIKYKKNIKIRIGRHNFYP